jgi:16S rRNA (cytosine967-C5)-methyltransferase
VTGAGQRPDRPRRPQRAGQRPAAPGSSGPGQKRQWGTYRKAEPDAARRAAFDVLVAVSARDAYANLTLPPLLAERGMSGRDAAFATEVVYGTLRMRGLLDAVLTACSTRPVDKVDLRVLQMLRMGAYQLLFMRVPDHAAVAATVEVARVALTDGPARFVNAVLRRVAERDVAAWVTAVAPNPVTDPAGHLAVRYSHPEWIVRAFADALGTRIDVNTKVDGAQPPVVENAENVAADPFDPAVSELAAALAADNERPTVDLAARPGRLTADELLALTGGAEPGRWSPYAVRLTGGDPGRLPAVEDGRAHVQDEGSQLCAWAVANAPLNGTDAKWLDLCAGPGGKAGLLAGLVDGTGGDLTAVEISEHRAKLVADALRGYPATVVTADGRDVGEHPQLPAGGFDRVLVDAPCTGLGALRRRPEARWRRTPGDVPTLIKLQRELLLAGLRAARPGGLVGYATCSPHLAETRVLVADVCRRSGATLVDARTGLTSLGVPNLGPGPTVQLWPHRHGTDAMFLALLRSPAAD